MKPGVARGLRRLIPRKSRTVDRRSAVASGASQSSPAAGDEEFDPAEFAEFLEADDSPVPVDPFFKEQLRERLWSLVSERAEPATEDDPPPRAQRSSPSRH